MDAIWVQTDEREDVAGSVRHILQCAQLVDRDPYPWKWVILSLHSALQGSCVCHLTTSAQPVGAVTKQNAAEWITYFEDSRANPNAKRPKTRLMALPALLTAIRMPYSAGDRSNAQGIAISDSELAWLHLFHEEIRNQFVHFEPMGWSIDVSGIPQIANLIARIILDLIAVGYAFRHMGNNCLDEMKQNLETVISYDWPN